jgi:NAD(P)-dependent dehydrogenase (short-subunit alcohol dehydrogenase family)
VDVVGKGVVVTGAGNGIGRAIAARLSNEGARVVVNDLDSEAAASTASEIGGFAVAGDAATTTGVAELIHSAREHLGTIDIFFANAGIGAGKGLDATEEVWSRAFEVNVMAHVRAAQLLVPFWLEQGSGRFVATASAAGLLSIIGNAPYAVTKHGAVAFAEWLSITYGNRGLTVQVICPQGVKTRMLDNSGALKDLLSHDTALEPEQVAETVWQALQDDRFLILPHPEVQGYYEFRASQTDRWLRGMRKLQDRIDEAKGV